MGGFDMPYGIVYDDTLDAIDTDVLGIFAIIYLLIVFFSLAVSMASYILHSFGLYTIAQRRGIHNSWLAWVPLGNLWILGNISDQFQYLTKGKIKNRRKIMLALSIGMLGCCLMIFVTGVFSMFLGDGLFVLFGVIGGGLLVSAFAIGLTVLQYMSYYDLYCSCQPNEAVLYLILSIVFSAILPLLVFVCRKKDLGMPPRKKPPVQQVVVPEIVVEPEMEVEAELAEETEIAVEPEAAFVQPEEGFAQPEEFVEE